MSETTTQNTDPVDPVEAIHPTESSQDGSPQGEEAAVKPGAETSPPQQPEAQPPAPSDWRDKRIATLTRRLREMQERQGQPEAKQSEAKPPLQMDQALIDQRAREIAAINDFNRRCDEAALSGRAQFGEAEFNGRIANLQKLSDPTDAASVQAYNSLLMAALEVGDPEKILFELGSDLNEAQRILGMTPTKMAVELTKRAAKMPTQVSAAPKPITPIGARTASHEPIEPDDPTKSDHLSTAEWMRRREAQLTSRRAAG
jgi:hypothetical protein